MRWKMNSDLAEDGTCRTHGAIWPLPTDDPASRTETTPLACNHRKETNDFAPRAGACGGAVALLRFCAARLSLSQFLVAVAA
jgi:hypothetical protein